MSWDQPGIREYTRRMNRVLDHIDKHLEHELTLPTLADVAHFSPYHFHRLFAAWMGETLGDYLRRRRLEVAAMILVARPPRPVTDVALSVGFGSGEAFARAFKLHFGCTPSTWREGAAARRAEELAAIRQRRILAMRNLNQALRNSDQAVFDGDEHDGGAETLHLETTMDVRLTDLPTVQVAYLRHIGPYGIPVKAFWINQVIPWRAANNLEHLPLYGMGHDDPAVTPAEKCRYDACVALPPEHPYYSKAQLTTLPGGRYAVGKFHGTSLEISDAWTMLFRDWLPANGLQFDARPCFESYGISLEGDAETGVFSCELCVPVRPL